MAGGARHKIVIAGSFQPNCNCVFNLLNPGVRRTPEASGPHHYNPNYIPTASWTYPATSRVMFEAGFSAQIVNQHDKREPGIPETNIQITDQGLNLTYGNIPTRTLPRRQYQERFSMSYVTGSHNFKTGMTLRRRHHRRISTNWATTCGCTTGRRPTGSTMACRTRSTITDAPWNFEESVRDHGDLRAGPVDHPAT